MQTRPQRPGNGHPASGCSILPLALKAGWSEEEIAKTENGIPEGEREKAILDFVDECVGNVKVSAGTFRRIRPPYDDTHITGLTLMTGHDMMTARFRETPEVDPDGSATPRDAVGVEQDILPVIHEKNPFR